MGVFNRSIGMSPIVEGSRTKRSVRIRQDVQIYTETLTLSFVGQKVVNFAGGTVVCDDSEALVVHVENQVLTLRER